MDREQYIEVLSKAVKTEKEFNEHDPIQISLECIEDILQLLKEQEAKTGHWIDTTQTIGFPRCECSVCNSEAGAIWMQYCPICGAKMEGR